MIVMPTALRLRRLAMLLTLVLSLPLVAHAGQAPAAHTDQASRHAKAAQLVALLHTERMVQQNSATITKQLSDAADKVAGPDPTPESKARLLAVEKNISQLIDAQLGWKAMQPGIVDLYAKNFTERELDAIIAFYKTPAGLALISKIPWIDGQVQQLAQSRMSLLQPQIGQALNDFSKSQATPATPAAPVTSPAPSAPAPTASTPK
jgi:hypothetical protein